MPWYDKEDSDANNEKAKKAYESLMIITLKKPDNEKYFNFSREVKEQAKIDFPEYNYEEDEVGYHGNQ